jgi:N-acetylmuramoyl-L-alanine amidase
VRTMVCGLVMVFALVSGGELRAEAGGGNVRFTDDLPESEIEILSSPPRRELAQFGQWFQPEPAPSPPPREQVKSAPQGTAPSGEDGEFVFAGAFAKQLRQIDPKAKVEWSGTALRIEVNGQKFSLFPRGNEIVVNGNVEKVAQPLQVRQGEIFIPQALVTRIGTELEKKAAADAATSVTATVTPSATVLPDLTESTPSIPTTTTITMEATPVPTAPPDIITDAQPTATPVSATPSPTPAVTAAPESGPAATPFPRASLTPKPSATPLTKTEISTPPPKRTPKPVRTTAPPTSELWSTDRFYLALKDKTDLDSYKIPGFKFSELASRASERSIKKIVIHPDDSPVSKGAGSLSGPEITLDIAQRVQAQLESKGIQIVLTRTSTTPTPLGKKLEIIMNSGAQALLIISVSENPDFPDLAGFRVLYANDSVDYGAIRTGTSDPMDQAPAEMNYRPFQNANKILATATQNALRQALDREPVGLNPAPLYLARRAPMASTQVVLGYLSNSGDARRLTEMVNQDKIAAALVAAIETYAAHVSQGGHATGGAQ